MVNIKERWASLEKKEKFRQHYPEAKVICLAMIGNSYRYKGDDLMELRFAQAAVVQDAYRNAVNQGAQTFFSQGVVHVPASAETESLKEALSKHCFGMDMQEMRYLIGAAVTPANAPFVREKRRNFYDDMNNCPEWWRRTSVPFSSLNHPKDGQRRPTICQVYELIESLQDHLNIVPYPPSKRRRLDYRSRFHGSLTLSTPVTSNLPSSDSSASTPSASSFDSVIHTTPSDSTFHTTPSDSTSHTTPSDSTSHTTPSGSASHTTPSDSTSHTTPSDSTSHTTPSTSHTTPSGSTSHTTPSDSTSHITPSDSTSHTTPSDSTSHTTPSDSTSHTTPSDSTSHTTPSDSTSHTTPYDSTSHTTPSDSTSHTTHSAENNRLKAFHESIQDNSVEILKIFGDGSWNDLVVLIDEVIGHLPEIPTSLSASWKTKRLLEVNPKYIDFIPESVGKRIALASTSDGNCLFNSFSSVLYGDEQCAFLLRLMFVVLMASKVLEYSKYIAEEYEDDCQMWLSAVSGSDYEIPEHLSFPEKIEVLCRQELLLTSKFPYRDCNLFHIHALSSILGRPVINHFGRKGMKIPFMKDIYPVEADLRFSAAVHLLWVPSKPTRYGSLRHVVPLVCEPGPFGAYFEGWAFEGLGICALTAGANPSVSPVWIECTLCGQWVHDICIMVNGSSYKVFICGCDRLIDGQIFIESKEWYQSLTLDLCKSYVNLKDVVTDKTPSLRGFIFRSQGYIQLKRNVRIGRCGPFTEDIVDSLAEELLKAVTRKEQHLVPDIFIPEVLLRIVSKKENVNRLLAEKILLDF